MSVVLLSMLADFDLSISCRESRDNAAICSPLTANGFRNMSL